MVFLLLKVTATVLLFSVLMVLGVVVCYHTDNALLAEQEWKEESTCSG